MLNPTDVQVDAGDLLPVDWSKAMFTVASPPIFSPQHIWKNLQEPSCCTLESQIVFLFYLDFQLPHKSEALSLSLL